MAIYRQKSFRPLLLAASLLIGAGEQAFAAETRPAVKDMAYGETLFAFYQRQYFAAISRLLVARERGELQKQGSDGEWLLGGLYVQYGLPDAANDVFSGLLPGTENSAQALRIWQALAELNYRRARFAESLAIIEKHFPRDTAPEAAAMLAVKSLMRLGRYSDAIAWLGPKISTLPEGRYLRFNIAVAQIAAGDAEAGANMLLPLLDMPADDDEMRALRDRVALALAATRLQQERAADAVAVLAQARLDGPYSGEAMLVYGIAALRNAELGTATRSLATLTKRSPHEQSVQEGWIALAQTYEARNDAKRALATYRAGLTHLQAELQYLQQQTDGINNGEWFAALAKRAGDISLRDNRAAGINDNDVLGMPLHYRQFAGNRFVLSFTQYVEVSVLARMAEDWQDRVPVLSYLVSSRQQRHRRVAQDAAVMLAATPLQPLQAQQQALAQSVEAMLQGGEPSRYASAERQRLAALVAQVEERMARWPDRDWSRQQKRLALLKGALAWEVAREQPAQAWGLRRAVQGNARLLEESVVLRARVERATTRQEASVDGWQPLLDTEAERLTRLATESAALRASLQKQMEDDARETIRGQRERIVQLAAEAYFGIAQIEHGRWREQRQERRDQEAAAVPRQVENPAENIRDASAKEAAAAAQGVPAAPGVTGSKSSE